MRDPIQIYDKGKIMAIFIGCITSQLLSTFGRLDRRLEDK
jgi:hypothetical protein